MFLAVGLVVGCYYQPRSVPKTIVKMEGEVLQWFVGKTRAKQEKVVNQMINDAGCETFLPRRTEIRNWHDRKKKVEVSLIPNTLFVHATKENAVALHNEKGIRISYVRNIGGDNPNAMLVVPDVQMRNFIDFLQISDSQVSVENDLLYANGDKVIITQGVFKGIVGELVRIDGNNKVLVKLEHLIVCTVNVEMDCIEKIG